MLVMNKFLKLNAHERDVADVSTEVKIMKFFVRKIRAGCLQKIPANCVGVKH